MSDFHGTGLSTMMFPDVHESNASADRARRHRKTGNDRKYRRLEERKQEWRDSRGDSPENRSASTEIDLCRKSEVATGDAGRKFAHPQWAGSALLTHN